MNDVTWYVFGLMLTLVGLFLSYRAYQKNGLAAGTRVVVYVPTKAGAAKARAARPMRAATKPARTAARKR